MMVKAKKGSEIVAANLRRHRQDRGWSLAEASSRLGEAGHPMVGQVVSKIELGHRRIDADDLIAFAAIYEVPVATLFEESPTTPDIGGLIEEMVAVDREILDVIATSETRIAVLTGDQQRRWRAVLDHAAAQGAASVEHDIAANAGHAASDLVSRLHSELSKEQPDVQYQEGHPGKR